MTAPKTPSPLSHELSLAAKTLASVLKGRSLPVAIDAVLSQGRTPATPKTRGAVLDITSLTLRYLAFARETVDALSSKKPSEPVRSLLCCAVTLLWRKDAGGTLRYPEHTLLNEAVTAASLLPAPGAKGYVNAVLRTFIRRRDELVPKTEDELFAASFPAWWIRKTKKHYPDNWRRILSASNEPAELALRVNVLKTTPEEYLKTLENAGINGFLSGTCGIVLENAVPVSKLPGFFDGFCSVQDTSAQLAAGLLDLKDGMRVLDACSAPGGKACHMLETARISLTALDADEKRLALVKDNLSRLGLSATLIAGDASDDGWWDGVPFDRILADVPCTASGVLRRHPDARWLRRESDSQQLSSTSRKIIKNLWKMLSSGGYLLFATCSVWPEESASQADALAAGLPGCERLDAPGQLLPGAGGNGTGDGLFYCLFRKHA